MRYPQRRENELTNDRGRQDRQRSRSDGLTGGPHATLTLLVSLFLGACAPMGAGGYLGGNPYGSYPYGAPGGYNSFSGASLQTVAPEDDPLALTSGLKFRDGWVLGWDEGLDKFQSHFPNAGIRCDNTNSTNLTPSERACVVPTSILLTEVTGSDAFANFYRGKLFCVWLFYDRSELADLRDTIQQGFGQPEVVTPTMERWSADMVMVDLLTPQAGDSTGTLVMTYKPLMKAMLNDVRPPRLDSSDRNPIP